MIINLRIIDNEALVNNRYILQVGEILINNNYDILNTTSNLKFSSIYHNHDDGYCYRDPRITAHILNTNNPHSITVNHLNLQNIANSIPLYKEDNLNTLPNKTLALSNLGIITYSNPVVKIDKSDSSKTSTEFFDTGANTYNTNSTLLANSVILLGSPEAGSTIPMLPALDATNLINLNVASTPDENYSGFKNLLINGDFRVRQMSSAIFANKFGQTSITNFMICDMWKVEVGNVYNDVDYCHIYRKLNDDTYITNAIKLGAIDYYSSFSLFTTSKHNVHKELAVNEYCSSNNILLTYTKPAYDSTKSWNGINNSTSTLSTNVSIDPAVVLNKPLCLSFYYLNSNTLATTARLQIQLIGSNVGPSIDKTITLFPCTLLRTGATGTNLTNTVLPTNSILVSNVYRNNSTVTFSSTTQPTLSIVSTITNSLTQITTDQINSGYYIYNSTSNCINSYGIVNTTTAVAAKSALASNGFWARQYIVDTLSNTALSYTLNKREVKLAVTLTFDKPLIVSNIQLEIGQYPTSFENLDIDLQKYFCKRYMSVLNNNMIGYGSNIAVMNLRSNTAALYDFGSSFISFGMPLNNNFNNYYLFNKSIFSGITSISAANGGSSTISAFPIYTTSPIKYTTLYPSTAAILFVSTNSKSTLTISAPSTVYNSASATPTTTICSSTATPIALLPDKFNSNLFMNFNLVNKPFNEAIVFTDSRSSILSFGKTISDTARSTIHSCSLSIIDPNIL
jgi:hypothetical protein